MTGTSIDGDLDAALLAIEGEGLAMQATVVASLSWPLGALASELRAIASGAAFATAAIEAMKKQSPSPPCAVSFPEGDFGEWSPSMRL